MATVLVPIANGSEELEAVTIVDLLRRAEIDVTVAGLDERTVTCSRGTVLMADTTLDEALGRDYDMVVLPGGAGGARKLDADPRIHELLREAAAAGRDTAAICAAPSVLAHAGLLEGRRATSFPGFLDPDETPGLTYLEDPVVADGNIVTSRGPGTAMDFALDLIERLAGRARRDEVEGRLQRPGA